MVSTSVSAADLETKSGKKYLFLDKSRLATALVFLSVMSMWSSPPCPGVQRRVPLMSDC